MTHVAKYSHIDSAEQNFHKLSSQLQDLKSELDEIDSLAVSGFKEISTSQRAIDLWFNNIFTSLSVYEQVKDNAKQINQLLHNLNAIEFELKTKLSNEEEKLARNKQREEELLLSTQ